MDQLSSPHVLQALDWVVIGLYLLATLALGLYFTKRAGSDMSSFFVSGRTLPWYLSGVSMIATSFASDTPLWITALVRKYGVYYIWQYWAPAIGSTLAIVLFARLWRRMAVLTDIEFIELRYSGNGAAALRGFTGFTQALLYCPLIIGWVTKAMEVIARESMGLSPEYRLITTGVVVVVALLSCALSGLWGVVYTDFIQFFLATVGTIILACYAVSKVGGLDVMVDKLSQMQNWGGQALTISPSIGSGLGQMSVANAIGYFCLLWIGTALAGGYQAQRVLACKDARHASFAMLLHTMVYYAFVCWPWIIVALCSMILIPQLAPGLTDDSAYPMMITRLLPSGLRGLLIVALLAAFMSTIATLFNWGASYIVNDLYKRFLKPDADARHYVTLGRVATFFMAALGAYISFKATTIQELLGIAFVVAGGTIVIQLLRWFWWRLTAWGELAGTVACYIFSPLLLFAKVFDGPARALFGPDSHLSSDDSLLGARMALAAIVVTLISVLVSYFTAPTRQEQLEEFVRRAKPFSLFWRRVIVHMREPYVENEGLGRTLASWVLATVCVYALMFGIGKCLLGSLALGAGLIILSGVTLWLTVRRINQDFDREEALLQASAPATQPAPELAATASPED